MLRFAVLLLVILFLFVPSYGEEMEFHGEVTLMGKGIDNKGSKLKVGEYRLLESASDPERGFSFKGNLDKNYFNVRGLYLNEKDQSYSSLLDLSRILSLTTNYDGFVHRLDHDPLNNLEFGAGGGLGSMSFTDADPGKRNRSLRSEWENKVKINLPFLRRVRVISEYNETREKGHQQASTIGHCTSCHIDSSPLRIHQQSREWSLGPEADFGPLAVSYLFRRKTFDERGKPTTASYPNIFPTIFQVRGENPFASIPDTEKNAHQVEARLDLRKASFSLTYVDQETENNHTSHRFDVSHLNLRGTVTPWRNLSVAAQYRSLDGNSRVPGNIDRDIDTARIHTTYRIGRKAILTGEYEYEEIERTNFPFDRPLPPRTPSGDGGNAGNFLRKDTRTRTDRYGIRVSLRPFYNLSAKLGYKRAHMDRPFTRFAKQGGNVQGLDPLLDAIAGVQQQTPWPFPDLTRLPEDTGEVFANLNWSIRSNLSISGDYRFKQEENDHVDRDRKGHSLSSVLWYAPTPKFNLTATYNFETTNIRSNLQYGTSAFITNEGQEITPVIDNNVLYEDDIHNLSLTMELTLTHKLSLYSNLRFTNSKSAYNTDDISRDIGGFSNLNTGQTIVAVGFSYLLNEAFSFYCGYSFDDYDDDEFRSNKGKFHEVNFGFQSRF